MLLLYKVVLVVILSTEPGTSEIVLYSFPTWEACQAKKTELTEGMKGKRNPENVTTDCRRDVRVDLGSR